MSRFVSEATMKVRIRGVYKSFGVATAPGTGATCIVKKPDDTAFAGSPFAIVDDGGGAVHVDITMPSSDYGIWWATFTPGSVVAGAGEDWWTHSPPQG